MPGCEDKILEERAGSHPSRPVGLSLTRNFVWTLAGNVFYAGCMWSAVVVLAKLANAEVVGQFSLALAVGFPATLIANLQLRTLYVTDMGGKYPFHEIVGLRYILSAVGLASVLAACRIAGYEPRTTTIILIVAIAQIIDCLSESYYGVFQRNERMDRISVSLMIRHLVGVGAMIAAVYFTRNLLWGVTGLVFGRGLTLLLYDVRYSAAQSPGVKPPYFEWLRPQWNLRNQLNMVWVALPLGITAVLVSVNGNVPRYVIEHFLGQRQLGIYSAISYIPAGLFMTATALGYAVFARMSKLFFAGDVAGFQKLLLKTGAICGGVGLSGFLFAAVVGRQVLRILYRPEYAEHNDLLIWLTIVGAVQCLITCLGCALTAASQFRVQVPLFAAFTATSLIACMALVPKMGLMGAAVGVLISVIVQLLVTGVVMFRAMEKRAKDARRSQSAHLEPAFEVQQ